LFSTGPTFAADWRYRVSGSADRKSGSSRECTVCTRDIQMSVQMATILSTNCNWWYCVRTAKATFPYWKLLFLSSIFLNSCCSKTCNVCTRKAIIKAAKRIFNSDKICGSYCDFYFRVTFLEHSVVYYYPVRLCMDRSDKTTPVAPGRITDKTDHIRVEMHDIPKRHF